MEWISELLLQGYKLSNTKGLQDRNKKKVILIGAVAKWEEISQRLVQLIEMHVQV